MEDTAAEAMVGKYADESDLICTATAMAVCSRTVSGLHCGRGEPSHGVVCVYCGRF